MPDKEKKQQQLDALFEDKGLKPVSSGTPMPKVKPPKKPEASAAPPKNTGKEKQ